MLCDKDVSSLHQVWVLTGDKVETAINIGYSSKLLNSLSFKLKVINAATAERELDSALNTAKSGGGPAALLVRQREVAAANRYGEQGNLEGKDGLGTEEEVPRPIAGSQHSSRAVGRSGREKQPGSYPPSEQSPTREADAEGDDAHFSLILTGNAAEKILAKESAKNKLLELALLCRSVIACRVSPFQKAQLVRLVSAPVTLLSSLSHTLSSN